MKAKSLPTKVKKSLGYSVKDGCAWGVMNGFGNNYLSAFAVNILKATEIELGLLTAVPNLLGSAIQPVGARVAEFVGERKKVIIAAVVLQALVWIPIMLMVFGGSGMTLVGLVALLVLLGAIATPAWTSLMGDLVPKEKRGDYFGNRNKRVEATILFSIVAAALVLYFFLNNILLGFAVIFGVACAARLFSAFFLTKQWEPPFRDGREWLGFFSFMKRASKENFGKFMLYACAVNFSTSIAGPFFSLYMLRDLKADYVIGYGVILLAIPLMVRVLSMPYWGKLGDRFGNRAVLGVCGFLVAFVPIFWTLSPNYLWLAFAQAFSGFAWAGFELVSFNFLLDATPRHRTSYAAYYNLWNGVAIFCGAILGGVLAQHFGNAQFLWFGGILIVFMISGILRLASTAFLFPWIKEVVPREPVNERKLFLDAVVVHPSRAIFNEVQQTGSSVVTIVEKGLLRGVDGVRDGMKFTRMGLRGWKRGFENFLFK